MLREFANQFDYDFEVLFVLFIDNESNETEYEVRARTSIKFN